MALVRKKQDRSERIRKKEGETHPDRPRFVSLPPGDSAFQQVHRLLQHPSLLAAAQGAQPVEYADRALVRLAGAEAIAGA